MNTSGAFVDCSEISKADFFSFFVLFSLSQSLIYIFNIVLLVQVLLNSHFWDSHSWGCKDLINMETQRLAIFLFSLYVSNYGFFFFLETSARQHVFKIQSSLGTLAISLEMSNQKPGPLLNFKSENVGQICSNGKTCSCADH